jgi:hypothetical protein
MRRSLVGVAVVLTVACLPAVSEAGRRCGGGYAPPCDYGPSCGYQYVTNYRKEMQKVWVMEAETVQVEREVVEMRPVTREVNREVTVMEQQMSKQPQKRTVHWYEWTEKTEKVKVQKPVTTWQNSTVRECVAVPGTAKQTVWECRPVTTPTVVERSYVTMKPVATPMVRDVVCYTPQVVAIPPSCSNPCGSTCTHLVPSVRKEEFTMWSCVPEVHKVKENVNVVTRERFSREVEVPTVSYKWVEKPVKVPVCSWVEETVNVKTQVPVLRSREENYEVMVCNWVPVKKQEKVQICEWKEFRSKVKVLECRYKRVEKTVEVMVPVTTCVPVAPPVCWD